MVRLLPTRVAGGHGGGRGAGKLALAAAALALMVSTVPGGPSNAQTPPAEMTFFAVDSYTLPRDAVPFVLQSRPITPSAWPATFVVRRNGAFCTATLVGPQALLTAAHCVGNGERVRLQRGVDPSTATKYEGTCEQPDDYAKKSPPDKSADWALCLMDTPVPASAYETISTKKSDTPVSSSIMLTGFGCTSLAGTGKSLRYGSAAIRKLPQADNFIEVEGDSVLCLGDSGGAAYTAQNFEDDSKRGAQIAVNSFTETLGNRSKLVSLATPAAVRFMEDWAQKYGAAICGLSSGAPSCR